MNYLIKLTYYLYCRESDGGALGFYMIIFSLMIFMLSVGLHDIDIIPYYIIKIIIWISGLLLLNLIILIFVKIPFDYKQKLK